MEPLEISATVILELLVLIIYTHNTSTLVLSFGICRQDQAGNQGGRGLGTWNWRRYLTAAKHEDPLVNLILPTIMSWNGVFHPPRDKRIWI